VVADIGVKTFDGKRNKKQGSRPKGWEEPGKKRERNEKEMEDGELVGVSCFHDLRSSCPETPTLEGFSSANQVGVRGSRGQKESERTPSSKDEGDRRHRRGRSNRGDGTTLKGSTDGKGEKPRRQVEWRTATTINRERRSNKRGPRRKRGIPGNDGKQEKEKAKSTSKKEKQGGKTKGEKKQRVAPKEYT